MRPGEPITRLHLICCKVHCVPYNSAHGFVCEASRARAKLKREWRAHLLQEVIPVLVCLAGAPLHRLDRVAALVVENAPTVDSHVRQTPSSEVTSPYMPRACAARFNIDSKVRSPVCLARHARHGSVHAPGARFAVTLEIRDPLSERRVVALGHGFKKQVALVIGCSLSELARSAVVWQARTRDRPLRAEAVN